MVLDYRERKPVTRNRPKKQPIGLFALVVTGAVAVSFAAGLLTGWLVFRPRKNLAPPVVAAQHDAGPPPAATRGGAAPAAPGGQDPPLTFYETLSKGNSNALIGSGINQKKMAESAPEKPPVPSSAPSEVKREKPVPPRAEEKKNTSPSAVSPDPARRGAGTEADREAVRKPAVKGVKYTVQVASCRDRKEAEATAARFMEKGLAAYVSELKTPDKGVWYRVRIGRHLEEKAAADLAATAGRGAMAVPE